MEKLRLSLSTILTAVYAKSGGQLVTHILTLVIYGTARGAEQSNYLRKPQIQELLHRNSAAGGDQQRYCSDHEV